MPAVLLEASIQEDFNVILEVLEVTIAGTIFLLILASFISTNWQNNSVNCISTVCSQGRYRYILFSHTRVLAKMP